MHVCMIYMYVHVCNRALCVFEVLLPNAVGHYIKQVVFVCVLVCLNELMSSFSGMDPLAFSVLCGITSGFAGFLLGGTIFNSTWKILYRQRAKKMQEVWGLYLLVCLLCVSEYKYMYMYIYV